MPSHSQFGLLTQRRFLPFFLSQSLGAFNDNVFKQGLVALVVFVGAIDVGMSSATFSLLAGALFILPYFLFSALGGQLADKYDKSRLARNIRARNTMVSDLPEPCVCHTTPLRSVAVSPVRKRSTILLAARNCW